MSSHITDLASKYVTGSASKDEMRELSMILSKGGDEKAEFELEVRRFQANQTMDAGMRQAFSGVTDKIRTKQRKRNFRRIAAGSATVCALAAALVLVRPQPRQVVPEVHYSTVEALNGGVLGVVLPDGSTARLTQGSKLTYGSDFTAENRKVSLKGEGYFDIVSDKAHPFEIAAGECMVRVHGTKFNFSAPESGEEYSLTLVKGSVEFISPDAAPVMMVPGDCLHYTTSTENISLRKVDLNLFKAWMEGDVEFIDKTVPQIAASLSSLYGKEIIPDEELSAIETRYSLRLVNRESLEDVMMAMETILPVRFTRSQGKILIEKK